MGLLICINADACVCDSHNRLLIFLVKGHDNFPAGMVVIHPIFDQVAKRTGEQLSIPMHRHFCPVDEPQRDLSCTGLLLKITENFLQ